MTNKHQICDSDERIKDTFLIASSKLQTADAVAAIILVDNTKYLMQLRDSNPNIFYPNHWGCFGGAIDLDESSPKALKRELREELELDCEQFNKFISFTFDLRKLHQRRVIRTYYEIKIDSTTLSRLVLHEGAEFAAISGTDLITEYKVAPYDAFAIWLHMSKKRFL
jgi:8-oxo-dGTP pyrophosphatase MutT (NUDIX family)